MPLISGRLACALLVSCALFSAVLGLNMHQKEINNAIEISSVRLRRTIAWFLTIFAFCLKLV